MHFDIYITTITKIIKKITNDNHIFVTIKIQFIIRYVMPLALVS